MECAHALPARRAHILCLLFTMRYWSICWPGISIWMRFLTPFWFFVSGFAVLLITSWNYISAFVSEHWYICRSVLYTVNVSLCTYLTLLAYRKHVVYDSGSSDSSDSDDDS